MAFGGAAGAVEELEVASARLAREQEEARWRAMNTPVDPLNPPTAYRGEDAISAGARPITIERCMNGFICRVGCQTIVFDDFDKMIFDMRRYFRNPGVVERQYRDNAKNG